MADYGSFRPVQVGANFLAGQQAADDAQANRTQNALAQQRYRANEQSLNDEQKTQFAKIMVTAAQYGIQSQNPKAFIEQNYPELAQLAGPQWAQLDDNGVRMKLQDAMGKFGPLAGIGPAPRPIKYEQRQGPRGSIIQVNPETNEQRQVVGPDNTQPSTGTARFRAMKPDEISSYGLPAGSSAQINDTTGQIQVLNKPSVAPQQTAAERKAVLEAKVKMPRVSAAIRRAERLDRAVQAVGKNTLMDGGPLDAKALQYTKDGREVMAAAAQLMPELQALTRVPGIGSQSDLEARLAALALPSLEFDPETNARSMAELHAFIQDLKAAYETIATGGAAQDVPDEAGPAAVSEPTATGPNGQKVVFRNGQWQPL
jgi:hypothetical protein